MTFRTSSSQRGRPAILVVVLALAGILASCASSSAPSLAGGTSPSLGVAVSPEMTPSPLDSAAPSAAPVASSPTVASGSTSKRTVKVPLGGQHAVVVTIEDQSGRLVGARPLALRPTDKVPAQYGDNQIAVWNPSGSPTAEVWVYWGGVICDTTSEMVIASGTTAISVTEGPRPACDASNDGRGVVLTFAAPVDATRMVAMFVPAQPTQ